jgi:serine/threonine-protein kinase
MPKNFWKSLIIAAAVVIPTVSVGALQATAQSFGAIARSPTTEDKGYSWNFRHRLAAEHRALSECENISGAGDCEVLIWARNACMSISEGTNGAAGTGWSVDEYEAEITADEVCRDFGGRDCSTTRTICLPYYE